jgi:hypothetical protein
MRMALEADDSCGADMRDAPWLCLFGEDPSAVRGMIF